MNGLWLGLRLNPIFRRNFNNETNWSFQVHNETLDRSYRPVYLWILKRFHTLTKTFFGKSAILTYDGDMNEQPFQSIALALLFEQSISFQFRINCRFRISITLIKEWCVLKRKLYQMSDISWGIPFFNRFQNCLDVLLLKFESTSFYLRPEMIIKILKGSFECCFDSSVLDIIPTCSKPWTRTRLIDIFALLFECWCAC